MKALYMMIYDVSCACSLELVITVMLLLLVSLEVLVEFY